MTTLGTLTLYEILLKQFGSDKEAKIALEAIAQISEKRIKAMEDKLLTKDDKIDLIDRIHKAKIETIVWVVGVGIVQLSLIFLTKMLP